MGQTYAGVLGLLAFLVTVVNGLTSAGGTETTIKVACLCLFLFGAVGYLIGRIAQSAVEDSVRAQFQAEIDVLESKGQTG